MFVVGAGPRPRLGGLHHTVRRRPFGSRLWIGPRPFSAVLMMKCLPPVSREISSPCLMLARVQSMCVAFSMNPRTLAIPMARSWRAVRRAGSQSDAPPSR